MTNIISQLFYSSTILLSICTRRIKMTGITSQEIVNWIDRLDKSKTYKYPTGNSSLKIIEVNKPEGPIKFLRWKPTEDESSASEAIISENQISTVSLVFSRKPNYPIHFDRLFSGGGNSRSSLETLLALTPHFYICYPQKASLYNGEIRSNLKHIMWCPDDAHTLGEIHRKDYEQVISEVEYELDFGEIHLDKNDLTDEFDSIEAKKVHTQMQVALVKIGNSLNFKTWIASNDRSIMVGACRLGDLPGVISSLDQISILYSDDSKRFSSLIDCIWFSDDFRYIPAVIEVEHSTGVTSGLTRMLKLKETIPAVTMPFTIVAPNDLRNKVLAEANTPAFKSMRTRYMPYSTVRELYGLLQRYNLKNTVERTFIEPFMEEMVN